MPGFLPRRPVGGAGGQGRGGRPSSGPHMALPPYLCVAAGKALASLVLYFFCCKRGPPQSDLTGGLRFKAEHRADTQWGLREGSRGGTCPRPRRCEWLAGDPRLGLPGSQTTHEGPRMGRSRRWPPGRARPWALPRRPQGGACRLEEVTAEHLLPLGRLLCSSENASPGRTPPARASGRVRAGGRRPARVRAPSTAAGPG